MLFAEAARSLGFGARIVSGYLYNPDQDIVGSRDAGSTHAWAEVYVPGAGWITFDPTNRGVGGFNLIPVAVARDIRQAMPVSGSFVGMTDALSDVGGGPRHIDGVASMNAPHPASRATSACVLPSATPRWLRVRAEPLVRLTQCCESLSPNY